MGFVEKFESEGTGVRSDLGSFIDVAGCVVGVNTQKWYVNYDT